MSPNSSYTYLLLIMLITYASLSQAQDPNSIVDERKTRGLDSSFEARNRLHKNVIAQGIYTGSAQQNEALLNWYHNEKSPLQKSVTVKNSQTCFHYSLIPNVGINSIRISVHATATDGLITPGNLKVSADGHRSAKFLMTVLASSPTSATEQVSLIARPIIKLPTSGDIMFNQATIDVARPLTLHISGQGHIPKASGSGYLGSCSTQLRF